MSTKSGLIHETRESVGRMLNLLLADEYMLYRITRDYIWNVTGPDFLSLRLQFQLQHNDAARWVDDLSECIRNLRLDARISWTGLMESARCSADSGLGLPAHRMLTELLQAHDGIMARLSADRDDCLYLYGDAATAGFLNALREQHENAAWMLRAQLETTKIRSHSFSPSLN